MPFRHLPNTDAQRLSALKTAAQKWTGTTDAASRLITPEHFASLDLSVSTSLYSVFKRDVGESSSALAHQADLTDVGDIAYTALAQVVSHFIQVFNLAVGRGKFARSDRAFYGLEVSRADVPVLSSHDDIQLWAGKLIDGEAARLEANPSATAMAMPAIGEVAAALATVTGMQETHSKAKDDYAKEQSDVETGRPAVDLLIADMWDTIEFKLRTLDGPSRRRRAREWGVVYLTRPGEAQDPATETSENPPPTDPGANP